VAAHLVVCCVLIFFVIISADCRVEYPTLGEYYLQQKLGTNEPPKDTNIGEFSSDSVEFSHVLGRGDDLEGGCH
jgi:hypothetical protein